LKPYISKIEIELEASKNKKIKGTTSQKAKERKEKELNYKLSQIKKLKERVEELEGKIEFNEINTFELIKKLLLSFVEKPDDEA
jgi:hypothetical protein